MILVTGDTHAEFHRLDEFIKTDYVIICGDFGGIWFSNGYKRQEFVLDVLSELPYVILFVDGNHENHTVLNEYDVIEWNGGKAHKIRDNILHLMRGQVYTIEGKKFFTFGGAQSHDIDGGILYPKSPTYHEDLIVAKCSGLPYRTFGKSWWPEEMPSANEMEEGLRNLEAHDFKVDYIITHCAPSSIQSQIDRWMKRDELTEYLDKIYDSCEFKRWYCGHYHINQEITNNFEVIYEDIKELEGD